MEPPLPGYYQYFWGVNAPCSRTQHNLTGVGLEPPTSRSRVRGINHQATALPCIYREKHPHFFKIKNGIQKYILSFCFSKKTFDRSRQEIIKTTRRFLRKKENFKPPFGKCFICQSELHWANNCPKRIKNENTKMNHQEMNPKQDILGEPMKCIYDSNLQILLDEITDLKTKIESLEQQIIQIIVIPLEIPCVKCQK